MIILVFDGKERQVGMAPSYHQPIALISRQIGKTIIAASDRRYDNATDNRAFGFKRLLL